MIVERHPNLTGKLVDVTRTKAFDTSHGPVLSSPNRQLQDYNMMVRMFGMAELQLRIGGCTVTDVEMQTLTERYPLIDSVAYLCNNGPTFSELVDDDEPTADEDMDEEEDDADGDEVNVLMVFVRGDDVAQGFREYSYLLICFTCTLRTMFIFKCGVRVYFRLYSCLPLYRVDLSTAPMLIGKPVISAYTKKIQSRVTSRKCSPNTKQFMKIFNYTRASLFMWE